MQSIDLGLKSFLSMAETSHLQDPLGAYHQAQLDQMRHERFGEITEDIRRASAIGALSVGAWMAGVDNIVNAPDNVAEGFANGLAIGATSLVAGLTAYEVARRSYRFIRNYLSKGSPKQPPQEEYDARFRDIVRRY